MLFLEYRPITRGRLRRSRFLFFVTAGLALLLYAMTLEQTAFPGRSASWITWASGLDVREAYTRPLLCALGKLVSALPWGPMALRFNLLAALAGALAVGWTYKLVWFLIFEMMREDSAIMYASRNARFGGLVAAFVVGTSLPFWQAATRFGPEIFDGAGLLGCAVLLTRYARSQNVFAILLFGILYGLGMAESELFLAAVPVMATFAILTEWKLAWCLIGRLFGASLLALLSFVGLHGWNAYTAVLADQHALTFPSIQAVIISVWQAQTSALLQLFPEQLWVPVLVLGIGAAMLSFFAAFRTLDNRRNLSLLVLSLVLTVFAGLMLFNAPFTPWGVFSLSGGIPAMTYAFYGIGIGLLIASWRALSVLADPLDVDFRVDEESEVADDIARVETAPRIFVAGRSLGILLTPVLLVMIVVSAGLNLRRLLTDSGAFADRAAHQLLDGLNGRTWLVSNGILDPNLLICAHERHQRIYLLCPYRAREPRYLAQVLASVEKDPGFTENAKLKARSLVSFSLHLFIDDLFACNDSFGERVVCLGLPDLWYSADWVPVPERLFFGGTRNLKALQPEKLAASHGDFWKAWSSFVAQDPGSPRQLSYRHRMALRRHFSFVANNLGVTLDDLGAPELAFDAYLQSREFWSENISALLNLFDLVSRGQHPEMKDAIEAQLRHKVEDSSSRYSLWALSRYYGYVRNYAMFVQMGWSWALSSSPGSVLAGLRTAFSVQDDEAKRTELVALMASVYAMRGDALKSEQAYQNVLAVEPRNHAAISGLARLAIHRNVPDDARRILMEGESAGASKRSLRLDWAALYLAAGDLARARVLLQELAEEPDAPAMTLAMLAMVMIEQNESMAVESKILPKLMKNTAGADAYFSQVVQGRIWQGKGAAGFKNARLCFHRAALLRPDVHALQEVLLSLDVSMQDQKAAEAHALTILRREPTHPFANYIMGSIRLEAGEYGDAESYLKKSVDTPNPALPALNNYAQTLCRIRRLDEALNVARQATKRAPTRYEGWGTLAYVLAVKGEVVQAAEALASARALDSSDARLSLVDALLAVQRKDRAAALKALEVTEKYPDLSVADQRELLHVREAATAL